MRGIMKLDSINRSRLAQGTCVPKMGIIRASNASKQSIKKYSSQDPTQAKNEAVNADLQV